MKRLVVIICSFIAVVFFSGIGYWFWLYIPFWLKEGECQLRPLPYSIDEFEYLSFLVAPSTDFPSNTAHVEDSRYFDVNTPSIAFSGCIQERPVGYQILLDKNRDGTFSHEEPIIGEKYALRIPGSRDQQWRFGPIRVQQKDKTRQSVPFYLFSCEDRILYGCPAKTYHGRIRLYDKFFRVYLHDADLDGKLQTLFKPDLRGPYYPYSDCIAFDFDRDGQFGDTEVMPLAHMLKLGNQYFGIQVTDQFVLSLRPTQPDMGQADFKGVTNLDLSLWSDAVCGEIYGTHLPAGRYTANSLCVDIADSKGRLWRAKNIRDVWTLTELGDVADFKIQANMTTSIAVGSPLQCRIEPKQREGSIILNLRLKGSGGELYSGDLLYDSDGDGSPPFHHASNPSFSIVDETGMIFHEGQFEYG
jgi:hypothetical protein